MKLIIDIDDDTYKDIKKGKVYSSFRDVPQESVLAIANGIPLDKIRAEIEFEVDHRTNMLCAEDVLQIIDKYRNEEHL